MRVRSRPAVRLAGLSVAYGALVAACNPNKVTGPPPPVETPVQVRFSAIGAPATACLPTVSISLAGPVGTRLTWVGRWELRNGIVLVRHWHASRAA